MRKNKTPKFKVPGRRKQGKPRELKVAGKSHQRHVTTSGRPGTNY